MKWRPAFAPGTRRMWLLSLLVLLGRNALWTTQRAWLLDSGARPVLAPPEMWVAPCSRWPVLVEACGWPWWLYAGVMAGLIARLVHSVVPLTAIRAAILIAAVSLLVQPRDFAVLACLVLVTAAFRHGNSRTRTVRDAVAAVLLAGLAALLTIEVGLLVGVICVLLLDRIVTSPPSTAAPTTAESGDRGDRPAISRPGLAVSGLFAMSVGVSCLTVAGLGTALLRPVSWIWLRPPVDLLPTLDSSLRSVWLAGPLAAVAGGLGWHWMGRARRPTAGMLPCLASLSFVALGAACGYYAGATAAAAVALCAAPCVNRPEVTAPAVDGVRSSRKAGLAGCVWLTLVIAAGVRLVERTDRTYLVTGTAPIRRLDPAAWKTRGAVLLLDLSRAGDWRTPGLASQYQLVLDDRWDAVGDRYGEYRSVCRDLREVRLNNYLRTDELWGGYREEVAAWSAVLLAVDSSELAAIRRLTLSMDWRVMGIDADRTIFGQERYPANRAQLAIAQRKLLNLEWPLGLADPSLSGTIEVHTDADRHRVAQVLCAMRLPYAALRMTRQLTGEPDPLTRAWCYLELAHRVQRHSGQTSVLDQSRAISWSRRALAAGELTTEEQTRLEQGLGALGLVVDLQAASGHLEIRARAPRADSEARPAAAEPDAVRQRHSDEENFGQVSASGQSEPTQQLAAVVSEPVRRLFSIVGDAADQTPREICHQLEAFVDHSDSVPGSVPADVLAEACFYLGCAAIEEGDSRLALRSLARGLSVSPGFRFQSISRIYLRQLSR